MRYLDYYKSCESCPVSNYCGTMISSRLLCNSLQLQEEESQEEESYDDNPSDADLQYMSDMNYYC